MRKSTIILTSGLWLLALSNLWFLVRLADEHARNAELRAEASARDAKAKAQGSTLVIVNAPSDIPTANSGPSARGIAKPTTAARDSDAATAKVEAIVEARNSERLILRDPGFREAHKAQRRLELSAWREDAIRLLGMTPEQADRALDVQLDDELKWMDPPKNPGNAGDLRQRMRDIEESNRRELAVLAEFLGEEKARKWHEYIESQPTRYEVRQLQVDLVNSPDPLRDDQIEPLVAALHAERQQLTRQMNDTYASIDWESIPADAQAEYARRATELTEDSQERARTAASVVLSPQQLAAFDAMRNHRRELDEARQRMFRARADAKQAAAARSQ